MYNNRQFILHNITLKNKQVINIIKTEDILIIEYNLLVCKVLNQ